MGRHRSDNNNFAVAGWVIVAGVLVLALIAGLFAWVALRDRTTVQADECIQGNLTLPVAEATPGLAAEVLESWDATEPVVRDHCVRTQVVDALSDAAVYIAPASPRAEQVISEAGRSVTTSPSPLFTVPAGLAAATEISRADLEELDADKVGYPVAADPDASVAVAVALGADDAGRLLVHDRNETLTSAFGKVGPVAVREGESLPEGRVFTRVDGADLLISAHVLSPAGDVTEEQVRAAGEFASFATEKTSATNADLPDRAQAWAALTGEIDPAELLDPASVASTDAADTLLLMDTSAATNAAFGSGTIHTVSTDALARIARDLGAEGHRVALWNYSSPLNPGVTRGWRNNVSFSDGSEAAAAVERFGTGGVPQTRSALVAAVAYAAEHSRETGQPARVLLVTSGTEQDMDDAAFTSAFEAARGDADVQVEVLHLGDGAVDGAVAALTHLTEVHDASALDARVDQVTGR